MSETPVISPLLMDRSEPLGNSIDPTGRRAAHVLAYVSSPTQPIDYDQGTVGYPDAVTEVYTYLKASVVVKTITITYTTSAKTAISGWTIA